MRIITPLLTLILLSPTSTARAEDWPRFRGPTLTGASVATDLPTKWSATENVAWKIEIPGKGWSSPVIHGGRIYLTTAIAQPLSLRTLCVGADGKILWETEVFAPAPAAAKSLHKKNGLASPTPVVTNDRVYVHFGHMGTAALDLAGKMIWKQTDIQYPPVHGNGASPILVNDLLVFGCDGAADPSLVALDAATGKIRWRTPRNTHAQRKFSFATALLIDVDGQPQIVSPTSGFVGGYDPKDGRELWRATYGEGYSVVPCPAYSQGLLVLSSGFDKPIMLAVDPKGAAGDVTKTHVKWRIEKNACHTPSPVIVGDDVYFVSDSGFATCADLKTGKPHWTERLKGNFSASPLAANGHVYFQSEAGVGYVVKAAKTYELVSTNDLGERTFASPAPAEQALILRSESHLWRIGK
jgi:outer membrane protein assembly factor BamB